MTYYNQIADSYEELHKEEQIKKLQIIKSNITATKTTKILDIGSGSCWSAEFFDNVTCIDPSFNLLKESTNATRIQATAEALPFKDHSFDIILCVTAIHHFNLDKAIKEMKRVGKNQYIITTLKKAQNKQQILRKLKQNFTIEKEVEEEKDVILITTN
jgi:ubiquinone/menaquinone biosynthesis C-methylase UbiE